MSAAPLYWQLSQSVLLSVSLSTFRFFDVFLKRSVLRTMYLYGYGCIQMDTPPLSLHLYVSVKMDGCIDAYTQTCTRARPGVSLSRLTLPFSLRTQVSVPKQQRADGAAGGRL